MKKLLLLILAIFITSCSFDNKNDLEIWGLNGNIKSISISQNINFDEVISKSVVTYNVDGNFESQSNYNSVGELVSKSKVLRRNNGNAKKYIEYDEYDEVVARGKYEYDGENFTLNVYDLNDKLIRENIVEHNAYGYNQKVTSNFYGDDNIKKITFHSKWNKNREKVEELTEYEFHDENIENNRKDTFIKNCIEFDKFSNCTLYEVAEDNLKTFKHEYEYY